MKRAASPWKIAVMASALGLSSHRVQAQSPVILQAQTSIPTPTYPNVTSGSPQATPTMGRPLPVPRPSPQTWEPFDDLGQRRIPGAAGVGGPGGAATGVGPAGGAAAGNLGAGAASGGATGAEPGGLTADDLGAGSGNDDVAFANTAPLVNLGDQNALFITGVKRTRQRAIGSPSPLPSPSGTSTPLVRQSFKVAENQTPVPVTRLFYTFNYFNNINAEYNRRLNASFESARLYQHNFGFEKAFLPDADGVNQASLAVRIPYLELTRQDIQNGQTIRSTSAGNLSVTGKYLFWRMPDTYNLATVGLQVATPTGGQSFANSAVYLNNQTVFLQPFIGYRFQLSERAYVQGFSSVDVPTNGDSATILYNDIQLAYFAYRATDNDSWLTALVPVFEVHVNTPTNHRGFNPNDPFYAIDVVSVTGGLHAVIKNNVTASVGVGIPVTGVNPYDVEVLALLNIGLGGKRRGATPSGSAFTLPTLFGQ